MEMNSTPASTLRPSGLITRLRRMPLGDKAFPKLTFFFALLMMAILVTMIVILTKDAMPSITKFGFSFFTSQEWNAVTQEYGALPAIFGTLVSSILGLLIAVPISLGAAIFLVELAPPWIRGPGSFLIEMLAAIPSVIIGLWGLFVLVPFIRSPIESWLQSVFGLFTVLPGSQIRRRLSGCRSNSGYHDYPDYHRHQPGCHAGGTGYSAGSHAGTGSNPLGNDQPVSNTVLPVRTGGSGDPGIRPGSG